MDHACCIGFGEFNAARGAIEFGHALILACCYRTRKQGLSTETKDLGKEVPLLTRIGHQCHETSPLDGRRDGMLTGGRTTRLAASYNPPVAIDQFLQQVHVLVIDVHRTRPLAIDVNRVFFLASRSGLRSFIRLATSNRSVHELALSC